MSKIEVDQVDPQSGTTLTLGTSGDTVTIPSGVTLANAGTATGFASIAWQSTIVTGTTHTASANQGIWIDTTSNTCNLTLPGSPSVGDQLIFSDFARKWGTNAVTLTLNGSKYQGNTSPVPVYDTDGETVHIVYSGSTQGWIPINDGAVALETPQTYNAEYLVVAGGGAGGMGHPVGYFAGGGGGAGGLLTNFGGTAISLSIGQTYTATVGNGGTAASAPPGGQGGDGGNSVLSGSGISTITAIGGGGGGGEGSGLKVGRDGGSGGGGAREAGAGSGGSGTAGQGNDGGDGNTAAPYYPGAGGGGAGAVGADASTSGGGNGGAGVSNSITGSSVNYAGGGGGAIALTGGSVGSGGSGGGGNAGSFNSPGSSGTANTGGGGGGASMTPAGTSGAGGSGVVILRVPSANYTGTTSGSPTVTTDGSDTIIKFTGDGSYTA